MAAPRGLAPRAGAGWLYLRVLGVVLASGVVVVDS